MVSVFNRAINAAARGMRSILGSLAEPVPYPAHGANSPAFTGDVTPQMAIAALRTAVHGDVSRQSDLFDRMLETDGHLDSVYDKRRMGGCGLAWELIPASEIGRSGRVDQKLAEDVRDYCADVLDEIIGLDDALEHMADAIGRGVSVVEVIWQQGRPIAMHNVPHALLRGDYQNPARLRIALEGNSSGAAIDEFPAGKFIAHVPRSRGGSGARGALLRPCVLNWLAKRGGKRWYAIAVELFGMPMTVAKYGQESDTKVRAELTKLIRDLGTARGGVFPAGADVQLLANVGKGGLPHKEFIEYIDQDNTIICLGQTLTTKMDSAGGSYGAAKMHGDVEVGLIARDIKREGKSVREQLLAAMVTYQFGERGAAAVPVFRRVVEKAKDLNATGRLIWEAVNEGGAPIPMSIVSDELGLPLVEGTDPAAPLPGRKTGFDGMDFAAGGDDTATAANSSRRSALLVTSNSLMTRVRQRGGSLAAIVPWMIAAVVASQTHTAAVAESIAGALKREEETIVTESDVGRVLSDAFAALPIEDMATLARHSLVAGELAGRWTARQKIERRTANSKHRLTGSAKTANAAKIDFPRIPFVAAIESLQNRIGLDPDEFERLEAEARSRAWRVAGVWNMDLVAVLHTQLVTAIKNGETVRDFRRSVLGQMYDRAGWSGENPWHSNIVFFQNFAMAHGAGRYREYTAARIRHWRFVINGPSCPMCENEANAVYSMSDIDRFPPLHFNCDCDDEPVFEGEISPSNVAVSADAVNPDLDKYREQYSSFRWDVAAYGAVRPFDPTIYPPGLQRTFLAFAAKQGWRLVG